MTDTFEQTLKHKESYDLNFAHEMAEQAIQTQDYDQSLKICRRALAEAHEQGAHAWIPLFEELIIKITDQLKSINGSKQPISPIKSDQNHIERIDNFSDLSGVGPSVAQKLRDAGYINIQQIAQKTPKELAEIKGIGLSSAQKIISSAQKYLFDKPSETEKEECEVSNIKPLKSNKKIENVEKSDSNAYHNFRDQSQDEVEKIDKSIKNILTDEIETPPHILKESSPHLSPNLETFQTNEQLELSSIISSIHTTLKKSGFIILPKDLLLSTEFRGINVIAYKIIDISLKKNVLMILPLRVSLLEGKIVVSENQISFSDKKQVDLSKERSLSLLITPLLKMRNTFVNAIMTDTQFRKNVSLSLQQDLTIQKTNLKGNPVLLAGTKKAAIRVEPLLLTKLVPGFTEKAIDFAYQRRNNLHIIGIEDFMYFLSFIEKKVVYIESYALSNKTSSNLEMGSMRLHHTIRLFSYPFIGFGLLFGIILVMRLYNLLRIFLTIGYISSIFYFGGLFFLYLKFQKAKEKERDLFNQPRNNNPPVFEDEDIMLINEELSVNEMAQFGYECFGKEKSYSVLDEVEKKQLEQLTIPKSTPGEISKRSSPAASEFSTQNIITEKDEKLIKKYSQFLED